MTNVIRLVVAIDLDLPLGPQVAYARAQGIPWKIIEDMTSLTRQRLHELVLAAIDLTCDESAKKIPGLQIRQGLDAPGALTVTRKLIAGAGK